MARTPAQRGEFGRWLERVRTARYATQKEALAAYERLAGLRINESEYAQWESGSRVPRADNPKVARLYEFYGSRPEDDVPAGEPPDTTALIAAIGALVEELRLTRQEQAAWNRGVTEALALLAGRLPGPAPRDDPAPAPLSGARR